MKGSSFLQLPFIWNKVSEVALIFEDAYLYVIKSYVSIYAIIFVTNTYLDIIQPNIL